MKKMCMLCAVACAGVGLVAGARADVVAKVDFAKEAGVGADDVMGKLVQLGRKVIAPERLKGFVMASWRACDTRENVEFVKQGIDLLAEAV